MAGRLELRVVGRPVDEVSSPDDFRGVDEEVDDLDFRRGESVISITVSGWRFEEGVRPDDVDVEERPLAVSMLPDWPTVIGTASLKSRSLLLMASSMSSIQRSYGYVRSRPARSAYLRGRTILESSPTLRGRQNSGKGILNGDIAVILVKTRVNPKLTKRLKIPKNDLKFRTC